MGINVYQRIKVLLVSSIFLCCFNISWAMEITLTVDDLPEAGGLPSHVTRQEITEKMLAVLKKHHLYGVYGFINGSKNNPVILKEWVREGQLLGNHTFDHADLAKVSAADYILEIKKNEPILREFMRNKNYHYFRYPYLAEGNTQEKRDAIRNFLVKNHYQIAPVTIDFFDYEWNDAYVRCVAKNDKKAIAWLRRNYLVQAMNALSISHELSRMLLSRDIKNILLIHINAFNAEMLDALLTEYEKKNVTFIPLAMALSDPVYAINPNIVRDRTYTFLNQLRLARNLENPVRVKKLYDSFPEDTLNHLCAYMH